ncbi:leucine-rich repeat domain-containing protein [Acetanaerobacterium elongatum]|uniref:Leucine Rich repeat-containing protein n=1 Tax=Acetanaerobacterium elongatum TaxID=258515 RepID=A0A1H0EZ92_9FIRM|nr:leucine-rich repeat domain-containing protein [Acetanaerobacterium elongatum]SDN87700.1 Leucine Rich repeat-containing protein [Acetanaerobacterium elongatum]
MKRVWCIASAFLLLLSTAACAAPAGNTNIELNSSKLASQVSEAKPASEAPKVIVFSDAALEAKTRLVMNKPVGDITLAEAAEVTSLDLSNKDFDDANSKNGGIKSIDDLQYFTGLTELSIAFNNVSDLSPISKLTNLNTLDISGTIVEELSPLIDLKSMRCLIFCWLHGDNDVPKGIGSLDALSGMENLEKIDAKNAGITDVSGLTDLPKLWEVQLNDNQITDVSPLANISTLKTLLLKGNPVTDFSSLKEIYIKLKAKDFELK